MSVTNSALIDQLLSEMSIGDLGEEFHRQAGLFARRAFQHARAEDNVGKWQERLDLLFGQHYKTYRDKNEDAKENDCKAFIREQEDYQDAQARLRQARYNAMIFKYAVKAFEVKGSMLMQLGADRRAELENVDRKMRNIEVDDRKQKAERIIKESLAGPAKRPRRTRRK